jgi:hypothetical protein
MTVRGKAEIVRQLAGPGIRRILVSSSLMGELQIQADGPKGETIQVFVPSSAGQPNPRYLDLVPLAPASAWRQSRTFLAAIRDGYLQVQLVHE